MNGRKFLRVRSFGAGGLIPGLLVALGLALAPRPAAAAGGDEPSPSAAPKATPKPKPKVSPKPKPKASPKPAPAATDAAGEEPPAPKPKGSPKPGAAKGPASKLASGAIEDFETGEKLNLWRFGLPETGGNGGSAGCYRAEPAEPVYPHGLHVTYASVKGKSLGVIADGAVFQFAYFLEKATAPLRVTLGTSRKDVDGKGDIDYVVPEPTVGEWTLVEIPMSEFHFRKKPDTAAPAGASLGRLVIATGLKGENYKFLVDDVGFTGLDVAPVAPAGPAASPKPKPPKATPVAGGEPPVEPGDEPGAEPPATAKPAATKKPGAGKKPPGTGKKPPGTGKKPPATAKPPAATGKPGDGDEPPPQLPDDLPDVGDLPEI